MTQTTTSSLLVNSTAMLSATRRLPGIRDDEMGTQIDKDGASKRRSGKNEHGVQSKEPNSTGIYVPSDQTDDKGTSNKYINKSINQSIKIQCMFWRDGFGFRIS